MEHSGVQGPPMVAGGISRHDEGAGAFGRAASLPAAALARSASGQHEDSMRLGELFIVACMYIRLPMHMLSSDPQDILLLLLSTTLVYDALPPGPGKLIIIAKQGEVCSGVSCELLVSTGPLHTAPSFSGGTVQTGLTLDAVDLQRARSGVAPPSSSGQAPGDLPSSKLQRHGSATHASSLEQVCCSPFSLQAAGIIVVSSSRMHL